MSDQEAYLVRLSEQVVPLIWEEPPVALSEAERVFVCIWQLEAEVNNGGFGQYYTNSAGDLAAEAPGALDAIGARRTAGIVRAANAILPTDALRDRGAREDAIAALSKDAFEDLDNRFLAYEDNLSSLLFAFVQAHRSEIRGA